MSKIIDIRSAMARRLSNEGTTSPLPIRERVIAVTGGKGGVGKSTISVNLALAYAQGGSKTLAVDGDFGMADLNLLLGVAPEKSLLDVIRGEDAREVLVESHGIHLLPGLNGSFSLESMGADKRQRVFDAIEGLSEGFDSLVIDVAAGIGSNQVEFASAAADVLIVTTPEPLSLADAYACLKVLNLRQGVKRAYVVPNRVRSEAEADEVFARLRSLATRFLDIELMRLPAIPFDPQMAAAAAIGTPLVKAFPDTPAARAIRQLARRLDAIATPDKRSAATQTFWKALLAHG